MFSWDMVLTMAVCYNPLTKKKFTSRHVIFNEEFSFTLDQPATSSPKGSSPTFLLPISSLRLHHIPPPFVPSDSSPPFSPSSPLLPVMNSISPPSVPVPSPSLPPAQQPSTKPLLVYRRRRLPHPSFPSSSSPHISQLSSLPSSLSSPPIIPILLPTPPPSITPTS